MPRKILDGEKNMVNKVKIIAFCPKILSLKDREIFLYFENLQNIFSNQSLLKNLAIKKAKERVVAEKDNIKIKIFNTGIFEIKTHSNDSEFMNQFSDLSDIAQNVSANLFYSNVIYDISIFLSKHLLDEKRWGILKREEILSVSSALNNDLLFKMKKEEDGYWISIYGIKNPNDAPNIFRSILSSEISH